MPQKKNEIRLNLNLIGHQGLSWLTHCESMSNLFLVENKIYILSQKKKYIYIFSQRLS